MKKKLFYIFICLLLNSCTAEQRLARIIRKHPELIARDTIFKKDTIITKEVRKDSIFYYNQRDTVIISKNNLEIKYIFNKDSTVYITGKCKSDTIIREIPVIINDINVKNLTTFDRIKMLIKDWAALSLMIFLLILILIKKNNG